VRPPRQGVRRRMGGLEGAGRAWWLWKWLRGMGGGYWGILNKKSPLEQGSFSPVKQDMKLARARRNVGIRAMRVAATPRDTASRTRTIRKICKRRDGRSDCRSQTQKPLHKTERTGPLVYKPLGRQKYRAFRLISPRATRTTPYRVTGLCY